ncbi:DUF4258 domain-containing protein [Flavihumibacter rivuli]|uniref:DUF4258 domain-containing protein n=1 Tax=Flavihumibacter rivuli TaxID=2838156 RepID=UPI001BDE6A1F|nr:DUF4258 domain-containing protein [Flavihumibacter rivuli]ULQ57444.1 DUF4258 domain-containing protein [Flavihumibacter rivuli]
MLNRKLLTALGLVLMVVLALWLKSRDGHRQDPNRHSETKSWSGRGLNRHASKLDYTRHALCRMDCRKITKGEVEDILRNGKINYRKSDLEDKPCPTYAVEGYTLKDNQHVRIVFAQCTNHVKVVTCIDLENDFECHCQ